MTNESSKLALIEKINSVADRVDDRWLIMTHAQATAVWDKVRELEDMICTRKVERRSV